MAYNNYGLGDTTYFLLSYAAAQRESGTPLIPQHTPAPAPAPVPFVATPRPQTVGNNGYITQQIRPADSFNGSPTTQIPTSGLTGLNQEKFEKAKAIYIDLQAQLQDLQRERNMRVANLHQLQQSNPRSADIKTLHREIANIDAARSIITTLMKDFETLITGYKTTGLSDSNFEELSKKLEAAKQRIDALGTKKDKGMELTGLNPEAIETLKAFADDALSVQKSTIKADRLAAAEAALGGGNSGTASSTGKVPAGLSAAQAQKYRAAMSILAKDSGATEAAKEKAKAAIREIIAQLETKTQSYQDKQEIVEFCKLASDNKLPNEKYNANNAAEMLQKLEKYKDGFTIQIKEETYEIKQEHIKEAINVCKTITLSTKNNSTEELRTDSGTINGLIRNGGSYYAFYLLTACSDETILELVKDPDALSDLIYAQREDKDGSGINRMDRGVATMIMARLINIKRKQKGYDSLTNAEQTIYHMYYTDRNGTTETYNPGTHQSRFIDYGYEHYATYAKYAPELRALASELGTVRTSRPTLLIRPTTSASTQADATIAELKKMIGE